MVLQLRWCADTGIAVLQVQRGHSNGGSTTGSGTACAVESTRSSFVDMKFQAGSCPGRSQWEGQAKGAGVTHPQT